MDEAPSFGAWLRQARKTRGWIQDTLAEQAACFVEAKDVYHQAHMEFGTALGLMGLVGVAAGQGDGLRTARLFGADEALRDTLGGQMDLLHRPDYERDLARAHTLLDPPAFHAAWAEGRAFSLDQALAYVRAGVATAPLL